MKEKIFTGVAILVLASSLFLTVETRNRSFSTNGTVLKVTDGDTLKFSAGKENYTVRLLGVDTPEIHSANSPEEFGLKDSMKNRRCLERWGEKASNFLEKITDEGNLSMRTDPEADRRGSYGRLLAYISSSKASINYLLVKNGYARVYDTRFSRRKRFLKAEENAREKDAGVWSCD